jgi:hypothetical protein
MQMFHFTEHHGKFVKDCSAGTILLPFVFFSYAPPVDTSCMFCMFLKYIYFAAKRRLRPVKTGHEPVKTITG